MYPQRLLHDSSHVPYIEILHAVIVLAWGEYKAGRVAGPTEYSQVRLRLVSSRGGYLGCSRPARADGYEARHESGSRKRRGRTELERTGAHAAPFDMDIGRA